MFHYLPGNLIKEGLVNSLHKDVFSVPSISTVEPHVAEAQQEASDIYLSNIFVFDIILNDQLVHTHTYILFLSLSLA